MHHQPLLLQGARYRACLRMSQNLPYVVVICAYGPRCFCLGYGGGLGLGRGVVEHVFAKRESVNAVKYIGWVNKQRCVFKICTSNSSVADSTVE